MLISKSSPIYVPDPRVLNENLNSHFNVTCVYSKGCSNTDSWISPFAIIFIRGGINDLIKATLSRRVIYSRHSPYTLDTCRTAVRCPAHLMCVYNLHVIELLSWASTIIIIVNRVPIRDATNILIEFNIDRNWTLTTLCLSQIHLQFYYVSQIVWWWIWFRMFLGSISWREWSARKYSACGHLYSWYFT